MNPFSQVPAVKMDSKNGASRKIFGPSYFVTALVGTKIHIEDVRKMNIPIFTQKSYLIPIATVRKVKFNKERIGTLTKTSNKTV